jgi:predicted DNA-binding transcriptional regulator AlpA
LGGMSRATFYNLIKRGVIPKGRRPFGTRSVRWSKTELAGLANQLWQFAK